MDRGTPVHDYPGARSVTRPSQKMWAFSNGSLPHCVARGRGFVGGVSQSGLLMYFGHFLKGNVCINLDLDSFLEAAPEGP